MSGVAFTAPDSDDLAEVHPVSRNRNTRER